MQPDDSFLFSREQAAGICLAPVEFSHHTHRSESWNCFSNENNGDLVLVEAFIIAYSATLK
jgi:hypothetical protein